VPSQGTCAGATAVACGLGTIGVGQTVSIRVRVIPQYPKSSILPPLAGSSSIAERAATRSSSVSSGVSVASDVPDPNRADNSDRERTVVKTKSSRTRPPRGKGVRGRTSYFHKTSYGWFNDGGPYWWAASAACQSGSAGHAAVRAFAAWYTGGTRKVTFAYRRRYRIKLSERTGSHVYWSTSHVIYSPFIQNATLGVSSPYYHSVNGSHLYVKDYERSFGAGEGYIYRIEVKWSFWKKHAGVPVRHRKIGYEPVIWCRSY